MTSNGDILARLTGFYELRLGVHPDRTLGCVAVDIAGMGDGYSAIMAPDHALDLAHRLIESCVRLRQSEPPPDIGPLSSSF
jgi:hypothetical protein